MGNPDDIHSFEKVYSAALKRLRQADISDRNRELIRSFVKGGEKKGNRVSTYTNDLNIVLRMVQFFRRIWILSWKWTSMT